MPNWTTAGVFRCMQWLIASAVAASLHKDIEAIYFHKLVIRQMYSIQSPDDSGVTVEQGMISTLARDSHFSMIWHGYSQTGFEGDTLLLVQPALEGQLRSLCWLTKFR